MTEWLPGIDRDDIAWIDLVRVTWGARSGVEQALLDVHLRDGSVVRGPIPGFGVAYETLVGEIEEFNRLRRRGR